MKGLLSIGIAIISVFLIVIIGCTLAPYGLGSTTSTIAGSTTTTIIETTTTIIFPNSFTYTRDNTRKNTTLYADINCKFLSGTNIYAGTNGAGLVISTDSGTTWTSKYISDGLVDNCIYDVYASGTNIFALTYYGLTKFWP